MEASRPGQSPAGYIRGGGGAAVEAPRVGRVIAGMFLAGLVALTGYLAASTAAGNQRLGRLQAHGVPVTATVSGCLGIGSGVGMGVEYWQCRADYVLAGRSYHSVIQGSRDLLSRGQQVSAVAIPGEAASLTLSSAGVGTRSGSYVPAAVTGAAALAAAAGWLGLLRRRNRRRPLTSRPPDLNEPAPDQPAPDQPAPDQPAPDQPAP